MPNRKNGQHWAVTQTAKNKAKSDAFYLTKAHGAIDVSNGLKITFYTPDKRRRDVDNLLASLKPALDGFSEALGIDDSNFNPILLSKVVGVGKQQARVEIEGLHVNQER